MIRLDQLRPFLPLISPNAVEYLSSIITPDSIVFESGCGTSTLWLAQRAHSVASTEDRPDWADAIKSALSQDNLTNVDLSLISHEEYANKYYDLYADHILQFPNETFDIVFVDGVNRTRVPVMTNAKCKIKPGGWLVVDDSNWPDLEVGLRRFDSWPHATFCGWKEGAIDGVGRYGCTTFFRKPFSTRPRIGIVSSWREKGQVTATLRAYDRMRGSHDLFFLVFDRDPLDTSLDNQCMMPNVTWADFKKGTKLFCHPVSWAREIGLDSVLYTGDKEASWMEELRAAEFQASLLREGMFVDE